jgi:hypothetical protein
MASTLSDEIAAAAARLVVEEGMEYGAAKRKAARALGRGSTRAVDLPGNEAIEDEVRAYIELFHADTQPGELAALRKVALQWMERLAALRPHLTGAVWRGTATRLNSVHMQLFCDDPKQAEIALLNLGVSYDSGAMTGPRGEEVAVLSLSSPSRELGEPVTVHLSVLDHDDLRGALRPDARGQTQRGDLAALRARMEASA